MKRLLLIIFAICSIAANAQQSSDLYEKARQGLLSYEECMSMPDADFDVIIPSLKHLKDVYACAEHYNADLYYNIVLYLHTYYMRIADLISAKQLLQEAINTFSLRETERNNKYIRFMMVGQGQIHVMLKNYDVALTHLTRAYRYYEAAGDYSDEYMIMMLNMAIAYRAKDNMLSAKLYIDEAIAQYEKLHGSIFDVSDDNYLIVLLNYATICADIGHYAEAEKAFLSIINRGNKAFYTQETYVLAINNLSALYMKQGRWSDGTHWLELLKSDSDEDNYMIAQNRALCYLYLDNVAKTIENLTLMNDISRNNLISIFANFSEVEHENYWEQVSRECMYVNNLIAYHTHSAQAISIAYNNTLYCNNLLLNRKRRFAQYVAKSDDANLKQKYNYYKELKEKYAYKSDSTTRDTLFRKIMDTELSLFAQSTALDDTIARTSISWQNVRDALGADEIALDYTYVPIMEKYPNMNPHYGVFLLRKDFDYPKLIALANVDSAEALFYADNHDELTINNLYSDHSNDLYSMLWQKITPYLKGIKTIYYSTTGHLGELNFDVMRDDDGNMLNDRYSMIRVSSTANIANIKQHNNNPLKTSVLYGNISYDEAPEEMVACSKKYSAYTGQSIQTELSLRSANDRGKWGCILSTKTEIDNINDVLSKHGVKVHLLEGFDANEESFKAMDGKSPDIIHLATHGFYIQTLQQLETNKFLGSTVAYTTKDRYMMWTGLMLAGGNNIWQGKFDLNNVEDGVLTADEISRLDLSNTKLVVLSACETGKGTIDPIDGVYGLQRAFKMAGAGTIVMSLWKVQDDATSMLMSQFYTYLADGIERHRALWRAMMDVRAQYPDPYYWAGFVMFD